MKGVLSMSCLAALVSSAAGFQAGVPQRHAMGRACNVQMLNLFGNTEESKVRRQSLSFRDAQAGDRKVTFRKPPMATDALSLGLKFREGWGKAVFIDKIIPGSEADRLKKQG